MKTDVNLSYFCQFKLFLSLKSIYAKISNKLLIDFVIGDKKTYILHYLIIFIRVFDHFRYPEHKFQLFLYVFSVNQLLLPLTSIVHKTNRVRTKDIHHTTSISSSDVLQQANSISLIISRKNAFDFTVDKIFVV